MASAAAGGRLLRSNSVEKQSWQVEVTLSQVSELFGNNIDRHEEAPEGVRSSCREEQQVHRG